MLTGQRTSSRATRLGFDAQSRVLAYFMPLLVLGALVAAAVGAFIVTRSLVADQEHQILEARAGEVAHLLSNSLAGIEGPLRVLGAVAEDPARFSDGAVVLAPSETAGVYAVHPSVRGFDVLASEGNAPSVGATLTGRRARVASRAVAADDLVAERMVIDEQVVLVLGVPSQGVVVIREAIVPSGPVPPTPGTPYGELRLSLYASSTIDPEALVLTTESQVPMAGDVMEVPLQLGADTWTLGVAARGPVGGGFQRAVPWLLLAGGLVTAVLATAVTISLVRRRSYALALVAERTTDLRRAQQEAEDANRSKSEFLSRMSHELRTPLNAVLGFGQLLELDDLEAGQRESVRHILKGGQHLVHLIDEVLDISRLETGNLNLSLESIHVGDLLEDAVGLIRPLADERSIELDILRPASSDRYVFADRQRTKQVLLNLLSNAVKYNRQRGRVTISCVEVEESRLRIAVADTGPGIPPERLQDLFTPFERLGAEQSDVEGTGIGLVLSKRLAEAMGGVIGVESVPARGSTFWLDLPLVEEPLQRYERLNGDPPAGAVGPAPAEGTILYIEDNPSNISLIERILVQRPKLELVGSIQGRLGIELAREHKPDVILLDLHLPDMGGEEVLRRLRDDPATSSIPVFIVSADATTGQVQRLQAAGAAGYLTKPINVRDLLAAVDGAVPPRP